MKLPLALVATLGLVFQSGCPHKPGPGDNLGNGDQGDAGPVGIEDLVFDKYSEVPLKGMRLEPTALGYPGMPRLQIAGRTLPKQKIIATKPNATPGDVQTYASMLWMESDAKLKAAAVPNAANADALKAEAAAMRDEARALLRAHAAAKGEAVDERTLQMIGAAELALEDIDAAIAAYQKWIAKFPQSRGAPVAKTWLAHSQLRKGDTAGALATVSEWQLDTVDHLGAYIWAWVKFRSGDAKAAVPGIVKAAKTWDVATRGVYLEAIYLLARAGIPAAEADGYLKEIADAAAALVAKGGGTAKVEDLRNSWLGDLANQFQYAGYFTQAADIERLLLSGSVGGTVAIQRKISWNVELSGNAIRLNDPGAAGDALLAAHGLVKDPGCTEQCQKLYAEELISSVSKYALLFHKLYAKTGDERYYGPAKAMYTYYLAQDAAPQKTEMEEWSKRLEETKAAPDSIEGRHDAEGLGQLTGIRADLIKACYEEALNRDASVAGSVTLTLEIDDTGKVSGVTTDPAKGEAGLALTAGCIDARIREWTYPSRKVKGVTAIVQKYNLSRN